MGVGEAGTRQPNREGLTGNTPKTKKTDWMKLTQYSQAERAQTAIHKKRTQLPLVPRNSSFPEKNTHTRTHMLNENDLALHNSEASPTRQRDHRLCLYLIAHVHLARADGALGQLGVRDDEASFLFAPMSASHANHARSFFELQILHLCTYNLQMHVTSYIP